MLLTWMGSLLTGQVKNITTGVLNHTIIREHHCRSSGRPARDIQASKGRHGKDDHETF